jgi:hypothetical protein
MKLRLSTDDYPAEASASDMHKESLGSAPARSEVADLSPIYEVNRKCIEGLVRLSHRREAAAWPFVASLRDVLSPMTSATELYAARLGIVLVDLRFMNRDWWQTQGSACVRSRRSTFSRGGWSSATATQLTRLTLVTAWHTLRANSYAACLFGMTRDVAELISALSLTKIECLVRQLHRHLRPRWEDQPTVWRHLLLAAQTEDMRPQRALCLRSLQLLSGNILCAQKSTSPDPYPQRVGSRKRVSNAAVSDHACTPNLP